MKLRVLTAEDGNCYVETPDGQRLQGVKSVQITIIEGKPIDALIRLSALEGFDILVPKPTVDVPKASRDAVREALKEAPTA